MLHELTYWHALFERLIEIRRPRAKDFTYLHRTSGDKAYVKIERVESSNEIVVDIYTFCANDGSKVEYRVLSTSSLVQVQEPLITTSSDRRLASGVYYPEATEIMSKCLMLAIKEMSTIWYN